MKQKTPKSQTTTWLTPPEWLAELGPFDLDPCACPLPRPWPTAAEMWTKEDAPLERPWSGRVWLNPPFDPRCTLDGFLRRMALHGSGVALLFARTETTTFFDRVWPAAHSVLFVRGRPRFHHQDGRRAKGNSGAPVILVAYSEYDTLALARSNIGGELVKPMRR